MSDPKLDQAKQLLKGLPPDRKMPGLSIEPQAFEFMTASFKIKFSWEGKSVIKSFSAERLSKIQSDKFAARRLKNEIRAAFNLEQEPEN